MKALLFTNSGKSSIQNVDYASSGYMIFAFNQKKPIPFPPGYKEDWLWCIENNRRGIAEIFRLPQQVLHDPPFPKPGSSS